MNTVFTCPFGTLESFTFICELTKEYCEVLVTERLVLDDPASGVILSVPPPSVTVPDVALTDHLLVSTEVPPKVSEKLDTGGVPPPPPSGVLKFAKSASPGLGEPEPQ